MYAFERRSMESEKEFFVNSDHSVVKWNKNVLIHFNTKFVCAYRAKFAVQRKGKSDLIWSSRHWNDCVLKSILALDLTAKRFSLFSISRKTAFGTYWQMCMPFGRRYVFRAIPMHLHLHTCEQQHAFHKQIKQVNFRNWIKTQDIYIRVHSALHNRTYTRPGRPIEKADVLTPNLYFRCVSCKHITRELDGVVVQNVFIIHKCSAKNESNCCLITSDEYPFRFRTRIANQHTYKKERTTKAAQKKIHSNGNWYGLHSLDAKHNLTHTHTHSLSL